MGDFSELFGSDEQRTLKFFVASLREVGFPSGVIKEEIAYVGTILAHYAQVSGFDSDCKRADPREFLMPNLSVFFDHFVLSWDETDPQILSHAGAQALFLNGFFPNQMKGRYSTDYFDNVGRGLFTKAARMTDEHKEMVMYSRVATHFSPWRASFRRLHRYFHDKPYLIQSDKGSQSS